MGRRNKNDGLIPQKHFRVKEVAYHLLHDHPEPISDRTLDEYYKTGSVDLVEQEYAYQRPGKVFGFNELEKW